jgi:ABC-type phosphate transport system substrate-binding protein
MRRPGILFCVVLACGTPVPAVPAEPVLAVIVHPSRASAVTMEDLARIYLRKRRFWDDGAAIVPLNQAPGTAVRDLFSRRVLAADTPRLQEYWNEQYFHGVFPPIVLSSGAAVKRYVAADRDAIGYLEWGEVDDSVRVVLKLE